MIIFFLFAIWISLGTIAAGYWGGYCQRINGKIDLLSMYQMLGCIILGPVGIFLEWVVADDGGMDWIVIPKYKSKGQKFLEKLES
jgi:hypothetical protein